MPVVIESNITSLQEHAINAAIFLKDKFPDKELEDFLQAANSYNLSPINYNYNIFIIHFEHKLRELFQNN